MSNEFKLSYTASDINTKLGQIANKQNTITGAATTITNNNLISNRALISNDSGKVDVSTITSAELSYLSGLDRNVKETLDTSAYSTLLSMPGSLKWNGVIGDKEHIIQMEDEEMMMAMVRISEEVPTMSVPAAIVGFNEFMNPVAMPITGEDEDSIITDPETGATIIGDGLFAIVPQDMTIEGMNMKRGVYTLGYYYKIEGALIPVMYGFGLYLLGYTFSDNDADKYFESGSSTTDVLTFDGNIGDRLSVNVLNVSESGMTMRADVVHLSDSVPTVDDILSGAFSVSLQGTVSPPASPSLEELEVREDGFIGLDDLALIIPIDNYTTTIDELSITFPKKGIYTILINFNGEVSYLASLSIPNYTFQVRGGKVLKATHLPEPIIFTTSDNLQTLTCNKSFDYCKNNPYQQCILKAIDETSEANYFCIVSGKNGDGSLGYLFAGFMMAMVTYNADGTIEGETLQ